MQTLQPSQDTHSHYEAPSKTKPKNTLLVTPSQASYPTSSPIIQATNETNKGWPLRIKNIGRIHLISRIHAGTQISSHMHMLQPSRIPTHSHTAKAPPKTESKNRLSCQLSAKYSIVFFKYTAVALSRELANGTFFLPGQHLSPHPMSRTILKTSRPPPSTFLILINVLILLILRPYSHTPHNTIKTAPRLK